MTALESQLPPLGRMWSPVRFSLCLSPLLLIQDTCSFMLLAGHGMNLGLCSLHTKTKEVQTGCLASLWFFKLCTVPNLEFLFSKWKDYLRYLEATGTHFLEFSVITLGETTEKYRQYGGKESPETEILSPDNVIRAPGSSRTWRQDPLDFSAIWTNKTPFSLKPCWNVIFSFMSQRVQQIQCSLY